MTNTTVPETFWIIEPRDPLIFRDARPFGPTPGARARSLPFPFPSTIAGAVRTQEGLNPDGVFQVTPEDLAALKQQRVRGPFLVQLDQSGAIAEWLLPAPADALLARPASSPEKDACCLIPLVPWQVPDGALTDLAGDAGQSKLAPVGPIIPMSEKPLSADDMPIYWYGSQLLPWLQSPHFCQETITCARQLGHSGPGREIRVHLAMNHETRTGLDAALFDTSGLEFVHTIPSGEHRGIHRLALALATDATHIQPGASYLGGERRLVTWRTSVQGFPPCPSELLDTIVDQEHCRLLLLTPTYFQHGALPADQRIHLRGTTFQGTIQAIINARPLTVSGWDMEKRQRKATRRLLPAGTVLYLSLKGESKQAIRNWVEYAWFGCIGEGEVESQDQRDGSGLVVPGTWSGTLLPMPEEQLS